MTPGKNPSVSTPEAPLLSPRRFFLIWLSIGCQSFGGGTATNALIRRAAVEEYKWVSEEEFARESALIPLVPGMNLLALTALIGQRVLGKRGVALGLLGLLLPSVTITLILTAAFSHLKENPAVQRAVTLGIVPATVGMGFYTTLQNTKAILGESKKSDFWTLALGIGLAIAGGLLFARDWLPLFGVLLGGGVIGALAEIARRDSCRDSCRDSSREEP